MAYLFTNPYPKSDNIYYFETDLGLVYEVLFKPSPYLLGNEKSEFAEFIFEFIISIEQNNENKTPKVDKKIGETAAAIFKDFYLKKGNAVTIYICDSSDGKQLIRKRKFDQWFNEFRTFEFTKIDELLLDSNKTEIPIGLIISKKNPFILQIVDAFVKIAIDYSK